MLLHIRKKIPFTINLHSILSFQCLIFQNVSVCFLEFESCTWRVMASQNIREIFLVLRSDVRLWVTWFTSNIERKVAFWVRKCAFYYRDDVEFGVFLRRQLKMKCIASIQYQFTFLVLFDLSLKTVFPL